MTAPEPQRDEAVSDDAFKMEQILTWLDGRARWAEAHPTDEVRKVEAGLRWVAKTLRELQSRRAASMPQPPPAAEDLGVPSGRDARSDEHPAWRPIETAPKDGIKCAVCGRRIVGSFAAPDF